MVIGGGGCEGERDPALIGSGDGLPSATEAARGSRGGSAGERAALSRI